MACFKVLIRHHLPAGTEKSHQKTVKFTSIRAEIFHSCGTWYVRFLKIRCRKECELHVVHCVSAAAVTLDSR
jgi:hypothetical protein